MKRGIKGHPPASEASREIANLTERKNPHTPISGVKDLKQLIYDFLARNNYPNSPQLQGGMKFSAQISPLVIYIQ